MTWDELDRIVALAVSREREACARVALEFDPALGNRRGGPLEIAGAIRARPNPTLASVGFYCSGSVTEIQR